SLPRRPVCALATQLAQRLARRLSPLLSAADERRDPDGRADRARGGAVAAHDGRSVPGFRRGIGFHQRAHAGAAALVEQADRSPTSDWRYLWAPVEKRRSERRRRPRTTGLDP